jgi:6-phosphogluconolactonase (cycloisomerase 2 family)
MKQFRCALGRYSLTLLASACLFFTVNACSGGSSGTPTPKTPTLTSIGVSANKASVAAGLSDQFKATATYSDSSTADITKSVTWTSASPTIATVDASGLATTKAQGTALITATSNGVSGSATLTVGPAAVASIAVNGATVAAGLTAQFKAAATYTDSITADISNSASWTSGDSAIATIDTSGLATTKAQGTAVITATSGGVSGSATLTVGPPELVSITVNSATVQLGSPTQLKATGTFTDQSTQDVSSAVSWTSTNGYVASVNASGILTPTQSGISTVTASQGSFKAAAAVTVLASPRYLFVAADAGRTITRMAVDADSGQPRFEGYGPSSVSGNIGLPCMTVDPSGTHVYVSAQVTGSGGSGYAGTIAIDSIDPSTGALNPVLGSPFNVAPALGCLRFEPSGKFAYATSGIENAGDQLSTFAVNADGTLTLNSTISFPFFPTGVAIDPLGQYLYVDVVDVAGGTNGTSQLYGYAIDATTGVLTALDGSPWAMDTGVYGKLSFHPSGNSLYASDLNSTEVVEYSVDRSSGAPKKVGTADSTCINPQALQFLPDGSHAYALCGQSGTGSVTNVPIVEFGVDGAGQLTAQTTAFAGPAAQQMQVDEAARFLYVLGSGSDASSSSGGSTVAMNTVLAYHILPDGSLKLEKQVAGHVLAETMLLVSGATPVTWTTTEAWVTTAGDNQIVPYTIASDGTPTADPSHSTSPGPFSLTMLPWGSDHLYALHTSPPNLFAQSETGLGSAFGSASVPGGIVIDPRGNWAYATDPSAGTVAEFHRVSPGDWGPVYSSPGVDLTFTAGAGAGPITMDPSGRYIIVANQVAKSISLIEPLGAAPTPDTPLGYTPLTVTVDATGNLIFVAGDDGKLHMLSSNGLGTLTEVATGTLAGVNTASIAVDPTSSFVYAAGPAGLNAFSIDPSGLTLTPISLQTQISLANATGVFLDPSGKLLYVAVSNGTTTNALYLFTVNADGTLKASASNPVATPQALSSMVFGAQVQ